MILDVKQQARTTQRAPRSAHAAHHLSFQTGSKNANGAGNIAELNLDATQTGDSTGLLAHAVEVLRLNTLGGVAPAGTCDPQAASSASRPTSPADEDILKASPTPQASPTPAPESSRRPGKRSCCRVA